MSTIAWAPRTIASANADWPLIFVVRAGTAGTTIDMLVSSQPFVPAPTDAAATDFRSDSGGLVKERLRAS
ncbi:hypothetical protein [Couchioplanes azureus]|uniref:hypothetical protein n=1 Tax=Couchioplanes caeruleus TaxID=56438 RepID=UPI00167135C4|nr:hypothetical protein [Couchioplanes caeruleus]